MTLIVIVVVVVCTGRKGKGLCSVCVWLHSVTRQAEHKSDFFGWKMAGR